jgi:hypothetical protein
MNPAKRTLVRAALSSVALLVGLTAVAVVPAAGQDEPATTATTAPDTTNGAPETPSGDPAIDDLVGCVQGSRKLLVLFLIDESASLKATDPEDRRVDAARGALDSLIALATTEGAASPEVEVALAAFSNEYRLVQDWTPANADTAGGLEEALDSFADFKSGIDTDFVNALSAGRESLGDQAALITEDGGVAPCRAVMLFTDGGYDLAVRTTEADQERLGTTKPYAPGIELTTKEQVTEAEALGRRALCEPGQLADRLRADDVTLLTVALSGDVARRSQYPLAAATTGIADDYTCGTQPAEGQEVRSPGAYLPAEDIDVLVTQFNGVGSRLAGGNLLPGSDQVEICGADPCPEGSRTFELDETLRRTQILALAPEPGAEVVIEGPGEQTATISEAGETTVGDTKVSTRSVAGRGYAIDLTRPEDPASWVGEWTVSIVDPSGDQEGDPATLQIYVFSDVGVAFEKRPALERGATTELEVELKLPKGVKAEDIVESAEVEVRLSNPVTGEVVTVALEGPAKGPFTGTYETPVETTTNAMEAIGQARIRTKSGAELVSQTDPVELLVRRPEGSIQFAPGSLKMPSLTGKGSSEVDLVLLGGATDGCVWFGTAEVPDPPEGAAPIEVTLGGEPLPTRADCIEVEAEGNTAVVIEATPSGRATGAVRGTIEVFEKVEGQEDFSTTQVPFRFDQSRGIDENKRLVLSAVLIILGLGLPLLALLLLNALTARFQALDAVRGAAIPVRVRGTAVSRTDSAVSRPLTLRADDFGSLSAAGNDKRFAFGGVEFRAQASRNPFQGTIAMAAPEGGAEKLKGRQGSKVELDPALAGSWIFLLDSDKTRQAKGGEVVGLLIAFVAEGDMAPQAKRMLPDIAGRLPDTAAKLAGLVREAKPKGPSKKRRKAADRAASEEVGDDSSLVDAPPAPDDASAASAPEADPAVASSGDPTASAAPADAETTRQAEDPPAPAAPAGFGGTAGAAPPPAAPTAPPSADGGGDAGDDDGPSGPPVGFSGTRPDA